MRPDDLRPLLAPAAILTLCAWYGCTPMGDALEPEPPARSSAQPQTPEPQPPEPQPPEPQPPEPQSVAAVRERPQTVPIRVEPSPRARPEPETRPLRGRPPVGAPKVGKTVVFDVLAADATPPNAEGNNEIAWFIGSSSPNPSWSPDGHRIAHYDGRCVSIHGDDGSLVGKLRTRISNSECRAPRWSPNGREIATSHTFHGPGVVFELTGKRARVTGGPGSKLMGNASDGLWSLSWLPDGEHLVGRIHQSGAVLVDAHKRGRTTPLVTGEAPTMEGFFPTVAPTGRHFTRVLGEWNGSGDLEVGSLQLAGGTTVKVKDPWDTTEHKGLAGQRAFVLPGPILEHEWSRDGARIVAIRALRWYGGYGDFDYGFGELLLIDVPSGETRVLASAAKNPSLSPDGRFVAFESSEGDIRLLEVAKPELGVWSLHQGTVEPKWSPAGHAILTLDIAKHQGVILVLEPS